MVGPRRPSASTAAEPWLAPRMLGPPAPRLSANLRGHCIRGERVAVRCMCPTRVAVNAVSPMRVPRLTPSASLCGPQNQGPADCPPAPGYVHSAQPPSPPTITEPPTEQRPLPHCWYAHTFRTKLHALLAAPCWGPIPRSPLSRGLLLPPIKGGEVITPSQPTCICRCRGHGDIHVHVIHTWALQGMTVFIMHLHRSFQ